MATQWTAGTTSGSVLTAATLNTIGAVSQTYTPVWTASVTNPNIGNGILQGSYFQIQKLIIGEIFLVAGSTTTYGAGGYLLSVPFPISGGYCSGWGQLLDASAGYVQYMGSAIGSVSTLEFRFGNASTVWQPTVPVTFGNADQVRIKFVYERT